MRKLGLLFALLPVAAGVHAETPIPLWNGAVYNQPVETINAQNGVFDCSQCGRQMLCRGNVEFAGHNDWGQVYFFTDGKLKVSRSLRPSLSRTSRMRPQPSASRA